jgi:hypothetical protein
MHKIKLKVKRSSPDQLINNLKQLNFSFSSCTIEEDIVKIIFHSQYQIERLLNITKLEKYKIVTFIEKFDENYKISFVFSFKEEYVELISKELNNYFVTVRK